MVSSSRKPWPVPVIYKYPKSPHQLHDDQYAHVFGNAIVTAISVPRLALIAHHHIPMRKNSKPLPLHADQVASPPSDHTPGHASQTVRHTPSAQPSHTNTRVKDEHVNAREEQASSSASGIACPEWATELMAMLQSPIKQEGTAITTKRGQVVEGLQGIPFPSGQPSWVSDLVQMLNGGQQMAQPVEPPTEPAVAEPPNLAPLAPLQRTSEASNASVQNALAVALRPKRAIGLRLTAKTNPPEGVTAGAGVGGDAPTDATTSAVPRATAEALEKKAMDALTTVKQKRAEL